MKTRRLTVSSVMLAVATVLSLYAVYKLPGGGSFTIGSMVPVLLLSFIFGTKWGIFSAICYSLLQCVIGFAPPPVQNFPSFTAVIFLDYILAFGVLGLADLFYSVLGRKKWAMSVSAVICVILRFLCHLVSGILIWSFYAPEGQSPFMYSFIYNGSYMLPECVITSVIIMAISGKIKKFGLAEKGR